MSTSETMEHPILGKFVRELHDALGGQLRSVVLYGSAARGDFHKTTSDLNLMLVLGDLTPANLEAVGPPLARWNKQGQPTPKLFSAAVIAESTDVFPIEFLDIRRSHRVLHGDDPLEGLEVHTDHLRLQCERELREKMMRLREAYAEVHNRPKELVRLLTSSYTTFVALFRGCLQLLGEEVPLHNAEVVAAFCRRAELDPAPFEAVDRLKRGEKPPAHLNALFADYYESLTEAVHLVNRFDSSQGDKTS